MLENGILDNNCEVITSIEIDERIKELEKELNILKNIQFGYPGEFLDWEAGVDLIRGSFFEGYAETRIYKESPKWIADNVEEGAALELQTDYAPIQFDGVGYWVKK